MTTDQLRWFLAEVQGGGGDVAVSEAEKVVEQVLICLFDFHSSGDIMVSKSAPVSPVGSISETQKLQRAFNSIVGSSKHGSLISSSGGGENIDQLEILLEAYFVVIGNNLSLLYSNHAF
ncbi:hypothetical protein ACOSQ4_029729 [Xanthoceras sorbifolium]